MSVRSRLVSLLSLSVVIGAGALQTTGKAAVGDAELTASGVRTAPEAVPDARGRDDTAREIAGPAASRRLQPLDPNALPADRDPGDSNDDDTEQGEKPGQNGAAAAPAGTAGGTPAAGEPNVPAEAVLSTDAEKTGSSSQAIQVPKGAGTIEGMGESFSVQPSTGGSSFSVPINMPKARGVAQPSLALSYSSSSGWGVAGAGWDIGVPYIARQTDRGLPKYNDLTDFTFEQDRFVFNGGQELVPICTVTGASLSCAGAQPGEVMPPWSQGSQYFRPRVEGSFLRFFWSPNHQTWRVQDKSGVTMELGVPLDGSLDRSGLEVNPDSSGEIYRWNLVRQYDTQGNANPTSATASPTPNNVVVYRYLQAGGASYLSDIYDTTPNSTPTSTVLTAFAHHTRLVYEQRPDGTESYRSGFPIEHHLRLSRIDVTSKTFDYGSTRNRQHLRRYYLTYATDVPVSELVSVELEGRCTGNEIDGLTELGDGTLGVTSCPRLPPMKFGYTPYAISQTVVDVDNSPPHSVDEDTSDLFDVNSDGLPDVLVTAPNNDSSGHTVYFNSDGGTPNHFGPAVPMGVLGEGAGVIRLNNPNVTALDIDGDATIDLLHMPAAQTYSVYRPVYSGGWNWVQRTVTTADGLHPKIDFGRDALETRVLDVNFDGLVDVVRSTGLEIQTYLALGRYPGGNGLFGQAIRTGVNTATLSTEPLRTCVPHSGSPVHFGDHEIQLADMNGDGVQDIVRLQRGAVRYWPGRGNGFWGTGARNDCAAGTFGQGRDVLMSASPEYSDINGTSLRLDDVNGDGLDDIVQIRFDGVDLWLNDQGTGFKAKQTLSGTPASPSFASRVRLVDINGSGTRDIVWANGSRYKYIDLLGGTRPFLLTHVDNGLGKTTDLDYGTSSSEMLAAAAAGKPFKTVVPTVVQLVKRVTVSDNLTLGGSGPSRQVTEYSYRDPLWDGRQREFRGFASTTVRRVGDTNSPSDLTENTFLLGECVEPVPGGDTCRDPSLDNTREALKGLPLITEKHDELGVYLSTESSSYRLRQLYQGRDGRTVYHAFETARTTTLYDADAGAPSSSSTVARSSVLVETPGTWTFNATAPPWGQPTGQDNTVSVPVRATTGYATLKTESVFDPFGNRYLAIDDGCIAGSACPTADTGLDADEAIYNFTLPSRPTGDVTGWLYRTSSTYTTGSVHTAERKRLDTTYDALGNPTQVKAKITGTVAMLRSHATAGQAVAAEPPGRSVDSTTPVLVSQSVYDSFGNIVEQRGANGRCKKIAFDTTVSGVDGFVQFPTSETLYVNASGSGFGTCGTGVPTLVTAAYYDRGLAKVTRVVDAGMQTTTVRYDGFGRVSTLRKPLPDGTLASDSTPWSVTIGYDMATPVRPYSLVTTSIQDDASATVSDPNPTYLVSTRYVDGLGRTRLIRAEADAANGDGGTSIDSELLALDSKGAVARKYLPYFTNNAVAPGVYSTARYDAFGRQLETTDVGGVITARTHYHALSTDVWDAADLESAGLHYGTYASTRRDGHGRLVASTERIKETSSIVAREVRSQYLASGELLAMTRIRMGTSSAPVKRWMRYDTMGRMVLNVAPDTSVGYTDDVNVAVSSSLKVWRYAYDDAGDLLGSSDARGCGTNYSYDGLGRIIAEDYSPCAAEHVGTLPPYSTPNLSTRAGIEVYYQYDSVPSSFSSLPVPAGYSGTSDRLKGHLAAIFDRASLNYFMYDARGNVATEYREVAVPDMLQTALATRYKAPWFTKASTYDAMDRLSHDTTGAASPELLNGSAGSAVDLTYSARGTLLSVAGAYGTLINRVERTSDGLVSKVVYGDAAATTETSTFDARRRLLTATVDRSTPTIWTSPPSTYLPAPALGSGGQPTFQNTLRSDTYGYDIVDNPTSITDIRNAASWPAGAKPVTRQMQYDDLYRLTNVTYNYGGAADTYTPWDASERSGQTDPRRPSDTPSHLNLATRVVSQLYQYDWLGNLTRSEDDLKAYWDRGMGPMRMDTSARFPYRYQDSGTAADPTWTGKGWGDALQWDAAGDMQQLRVQRPGTSCTNGTSNCDLLFYYYYDEIGRLYHAQRYEGSTLKSDYLFAYDSSDDRVLKSDVLPSGTANDLHTLAVFHTLELRRTKYDATNNTFIRNAQIEVPYLVAAGIRVGKIDYEDAADGEPRLTTADRRHVLLTLADHLGSTSTVIDRATSELVERTTYQPYGATESDYRPARWKGFREDYRFTGKEEDVEVGVTYFGKRFLCPYLARWVSPDPLAIHRPGQGDLNLYAYGRGQAFKATDPLGLDVNTIEAFVHRFQDVFVPSPQYTPGNMAKGALKQAVNNTVDLGKTVLEGAALTEGPVSADPGIKLQTIKSIEQGADSLKLKMSNEGEELGGATYNAAAVTLGATSLAGTLACGVANMSSAAPAESLMSKLSRVESETATAMSGPEAGASGAEVDDIDAAFSNQASSGRMVQFSDAAGPLKGSGPKEGTGAIWFHDNLKIPGAGPAGETVELRTHSANPNAPEGTYSQSNYTTQINTSDQRMLSDGSWKSTSEMTDADWADSHMDAGN